MTYATSSAVARSSGGSSWVAGTSSSSRSTMAMSVTSKRAVDEDWREQHRHVGVAHHVVQTRSRVAGVQADVRASRVERRQRADDGGGRAVVTQADPDARLHAERTQSVRECARTRVELGVGQCMCVVMYRQVIATHRDDVPHRTVDSSRRNVARIRSPPKPRCHFTPRSASSPADRRHDCPTLAYPQDPAV